MINLSPSSLIAMATAGAMMMSMTATSSFLFVSADCSAGLEPNLSTICEGGGDAGPSGFSTLCQLLVLTDTVGFVTNPSAKNTVFAPPNDAFDKLAKVFGAQSVFDLGLTVEQVAEIILNHVVADKFLGTEDLICGTMVKVIADNDRKKNYPQIQCDYDISEKFVPVISGPGNSYDYMNQPMFMLDETDPEPLHFCNANVFVISNVIAPQFVKKLLK